ncbi:hypothetical protein PHYSODRAFT_462609, partial [Phytophthora sojae]
FKALGYVAARVVPVPDDSTLVGVGEFNNPRGLRGNAVPPLKGFEKELSRRATVRLIDEYFTSKKCFACHSDLAETESRNVLHCTNSTCRMYWDRDEN